MVVGIGTALADDPLLTARPAGPTIDRQPRRVVFDSLARLSPELPARRRCRASAADGDRFPRRCRAPTSRRSRRPAWRSFVATGENEPARVISALDQLGARITSVLLEGGPHLAGAFLDAGEIDELRLFLAPMLLGGSARATRWRAKAWTGSPTPCVR